ncbi:MAG TPA: hypothetical protein VGS21_11620, partial [Acidimicrobiales bacterium]|nr:hypothetical protein [Acidimicrobiales bacterium]
RRSLTAGVPWVTAVAVVLVSALARPGPVSLAVAMLGLTAATAVVMGTVAWITLSKAVPEDEVSPGWPDGIGVP